MPKIRPLFEEHNSAGEFTPPNPFGQEVSVGREVQGGDDQNMERDLQADIGSQPIPAIDEQVQRAQGDVLIKKAFEKLKILGQPKYLGDNSNGVAYAYNSRVYKFTTDISEAAESFKIKGKLTKYLADIYDVYLVTAQEAQGKTFLIIEEQLRTDPGTFERLENSIEEIFFQTFNYKGMFFYALDLYSSDKTRYEQTYGEKINIALANHPQEKIYFESLIKIIDELVSYGIKSRDVNHTNLGYKKNGNIGFFDMGMGGVSTQPNAPVLALEHKVNELTNVIFERVLTFMPGSKAMSVKKKCQIGGNGDGTSTACNQGDISNIELKGIGENETLNEVGQIVQEGVQVDGYRMADAHNDLVGMDMDTPFPNDQSYIPEQQNQNIKSTLTTLRPQFAAAAQSVYDQWEQDENGHDEQYGGGGICDDVADAMCDVAQKAHMNCFTLYNEGYCHTSIYVYDEASKQLYNVDIHPYNYETGTAYTWKKIQNVKFTPEMVDVDDISGDWDNYFDENGDVRELNESSVNEKQFKEWFKNSEMVNRDGSPIIFYHGSKSEFDHFSKSMIGSATDPGWLGEGFYFYTDQHEAAQYGNVKAYYLNITNPYFATDEDNQKLAELNSKEASREFTENLKSEGYDGVYYNGNLRGETVVFEPDQIWNAEDRGAEEKTLTEMVDNIINSINLQEKEVSVDGLPFKSEIEQAGGKIYSVGGAVRDGLLNKPSKDLDLLITGLPLDKLEQILSKYGKVDSVGKSFGIIKFNTPKTGELDIAIPRTERPTGQGGYQGFEVTSDHNLPIEKDLERRDFTINAIAKDSTGNLIDPYNGQEDLKNKLIRMVNPQAFKDDPLRMLRAVQFAARFGFEIEPKTMEAIENNAYRIREISPERILIEFDKIVKKGNPVIGVQLLLETGLFNWIFGNNPDEDIKINFAELKKIKTMGEFIFTILIGNGFAHTNTPFDTPSEFYKEKLNGDLDTYNEIRAYEIAYKPSKPNDVQTKLNIFGMFKTFPKSLESAIIPHEVKENIAQMAKSGMPFSMKELQVNGNDLLSLGYSGQQIGKLLKDMIVDIYSGKLPNNRDILLRHLTPKTQEA